MKLPEEAVSVLKKVSASVTALSPPARAHEHEQARLALNGLRVTLGTLTDEDLASVAFVMASVMSSLTTLTVREIAETLENSTGAYSLAAAHLLKYHDIEDDGKTEAPAPKLYEPGGYL